MNVLSPDLREGTHPAGARETGAGEPGAAPAGLDRELRAALALRLIATAALDTSHGVGVLLVLVYGTTMAVLHRRSQPR